MKRSLQELTPRQIVRELDHYIVSQNEAKRAVAIALRNRWRRQNVEGEIRDEIIPNNILMIGSTGVGKTEIARRLARMSKAPFVKIEASKFTEVGYVGRDVEGMVRDLVEAAVATVRAEKTEEVEGDAEAMIEERLLDILLPKPVKRPSRKKREDIPSFDSIAEKLQELGDVSITVESIEELEEDEVYADSPKDERYQRSREKMRDRLQSGKLEHVKIELDIPDKSGGIMQVFGPIGMEEMGINMQEIFGGLTPKRHKRRMVTVGEARSILFSESVDKLLDMDAVISEAIERTEQLGIIFLDEVDKIAGVETGNGPDISREGVQRDILPIVEGTRVSTKYGPVNTDHILFIAAGAFHIARPSDLIPELQGRFPIRVELENLTKKDFVNILTEPKNSLVRQYIALFKTEKVDLTFDPAAIREIAEIATQVNERTENIGARRLQTAMNALLEEELFRMPNAKVKKIHITKEIVRDRLTDLVEDEDLSRYIL